MCFFTNNTTKMKEEKTMKIAKNNYNFDLKLKEKKNWRIEPFRHWHIF